jgi:single-strand DNA-binding protein
MDNSVTVVGKLNHPPLIKAVGKDRTPALRFTLVHRKDWSGVRGGDEKALVSYYEVQCYGDLATHVHESCSQGDEVIVMGKLIYREMLTDGKRGNRVEILADHVGLNLRNESFPIEEEAPA